MKTARCLPTTCRYCRNYTPQGHRGGVCQKLGVPVRGKWKACSLARSPFDATWQDWDTLLLPKVPVVFLEEGRLSTRETVESNRVQ